MTKIVLPVFRPHPPPLLFPQLSQLLILLPPLLTDYHQLPLLILLLLRAKEGQEAVGGGEFPTVTSRGDAFASQQSEAETNFAFAIELSLWEWNDLNLKAVHLLEISCSLSLPPSP